MIFECIYDNLWSLLNSSYDQTWLIPCSQPKFLAKNEIKLAEFRLKELSLFKCVTQKVAPTNIRAHLCPFDLPMPFSELKRVLSWGGLYAGVHWQDGNANAPSGTIGQRGHNHLSCQNLSALEEKYLRIFFRFCHKQGLLIIMLKAAATESFKGGGQACPSC